MHGVVAEVDEPVAHADDEWLAFELRRVVRGRIEPADFAESRSQITDDKPTSDVTLRRLQFVECVVRVLQVGAVEQHENDEESLIRLRADERILFPGPAAAAI